MVAADQPRCFPDTVLVKVSSTLDGSMLDRSVGVHSAMSVANRKRFCASVGMEYENIVYQRVVYDNRASYQLLATADVRSVTRVSPEIIADGLFTDQAGVGMMLPIADCVATVIYDPVKKFLALVHLGRHSTVAGLMARTLEYFACRGSDMSDVIIWMSPSAQKQSYGLEYFNEATDPAWQGFYEQRGGTFYIDMQGYNRSIALAQGVKDDHIVSSGIDTVTSGDYFSHSVGDTGGRFAVLAMMR